MTGMSSSCCQWQRFNASCFYPVPFFCCSLYWETAAIIIQYFTLQCTRNRTWQRQQQGSEQRMKMFTRCWVAELSIWASEHPSTSPIASQLTELKEWLTKETAGVRPSKRRQHVSWMSWVTERSSSCSPKPLPCTESNLKSEIWFLV